MIKGVYEAVLYTDDVSEAAAFYSNVVGLRPAAPVSSLMAAFRTGESDEIPPSGLLLVFNRREAAVPGREVPSHGTIGAGHVALRIAADRYEWWKDRLARHGVPIEQEAEWKTGARSIYFRDPAGNSVELVAGEIWAP
jgi:catechol 2,3-dioxygenase-like lactoylglutathione lyase family enzyme